MKKFSLLFSALIMVSVVVGQIQNPFKTKDGSKAVIVAPWSTDFNDNIIPDDWGNYDVDEDGYFWETTEVNSGVYAIISETFRYDIYDALTPDNYLVTAKVDLSAVTNAIMNWKVLSVSDADFAEQYSIYISTTGNTVADFTDAAVFNETLTVGGVVLDRTIDLSTYGDEVWVAFRHHDCTNQFMLAIPELEFVAGEPSTDILVEFNVDMNDVETNVFDPNNDIVTIAGDFTDPAWQEPTLTELTLTDEDNDGIYSLSVPLVNAGSYEYKYFVNAGWDGGEWTGGANRSFDFAGEDLVLNDIFGDEPTAEVLVEFNVNMNSVETSVFDPNNDIVTIAGNFTDPEWQEPTLTELTFLDEDNDGIYSLSIPLVNNGNYEYKYFINAGWDGGEWSGGDNRSFEFNGEALALNDVFGEISVGVNTISRSDINIYPNPTLGIFTLDLQESAMVKILNITGQEIYNKDLSGRAIIDIQDVKSGIYLVNITTEHSSFQSTIIKK